MSGGDFKFVYLVIMCDNHQLQIYISWHLTYTDISISEMQISFNQNQLITLSMLMYTLMVLIKTHSQWVVSRLFSHTNICGTTCCHWSFLSVNWFYSCEHLPCSEVVAEISGTDISKPGQITLKLSARLLAWEKLGFFYFYKVTL